MKTRIRYGRRRKRIAPAIPLSPGPRIRLPSHRSGATAISGRSLIQAGNPRPGGLAEALRELRAAIDEVLPWVEDAELRAPQWTDYSRFR